MIDFLRGSIVHTESDYVVIDVNDIGYRVFVSNPYGLAKHDDRTILYIHYHVREDAILLYGFATREEQALFRRLIDVSGIGPRVAIGILSGGRPEAVVAAIQREDLSYLTKLPGIGKKTAQRMVLDLKDKLGGFESAHPLESVAAASAGAGLAVSPWEEVKQGLQALGYSEPEVDRAWQSIAARVQEDESVESIMKKALQALYSAK